jgi:hypothetical protein
MSAADHIYDYETGRWSTCVTRSHGHPSYINEFNANQVNLAVITPPAGRRVCVGGVMSAADTNLGQISLDFAVSVQPVWRHYVANFRAISQNDFHMDGGIDEVLTLNTTTGANLVFLIVNYRIVDA